MPLRSSSVDAALTHDFPPFEVVRDRPVRRELTCVNVERGPKERFDRLVSVYEGRLGRSLTQWEAFGIMVREAEEKYGFELQTLRGR